MAYVKKVKSFSMAEMLMVMVIIMILLVATFPLITFKKKNEGMDTSAVACIKSVLAQNPGYDISESACSSSPNNACCIAAKSCRYQQNNSCSTIQYFADMSTQNEQVNARKLFREVCDRSGDEGCKYFVNLCNQDSSKCNITDSNQGPNYDLNYYLSLTTTDSNMGKALIEKYADKFYDNGFLNVKTIVDNTATSCTCPNINLACIIQGTICSDSGSPTTPTVPTTEPPIPYAGLWQSAFKRDYFDESWHVEVDNNGYIYLAGFSTDNNVSYQTAKVALVKIDTSQSGNASIVWNNMFDNTHADTDYACTFRLDTNNNMYISGYSLAVPQEGFLMKVDPSVTGAGSLVWNRVYIYYVWVTQGKNTTKSYKNTTIKNVVIDSSNCIYSIGHVTDATDDFFAMKVCPSITDDGGTTPDESIVWKKRYDTGAIDAGIGIAMGGDGFLYATGTSNNDIAILKINAANGNLIWGKRFGSGANTDKGYEIEAEKTATPNIYIGGLTASDAAILKLDSNGTKLWNIKVDRAAQTDVAYDIAIGTAGEAYLGGSTGPDAFIIKFDTTQAIASSLIWDKLLNGGASLNDIVDKLLIKGNNLYATGSTQIVNDDMFVIRMNTDQTKNGTIFTLSDPNFAQAAATFTEYDISDDSIERIYDVISAVNPITPAIWAAAPGFSGVQ